MSMRKEFVTILREVMNNENVSQEIKQLAVELMLEEIGGDISACYGAPTLCIQLDNELWIPESSFNSIRYHVTAREKIAAIREYRDVTGQGLRDSKDWVEAHYNELIIND